MSFGVVFLRYFHKTFILAATLLAAVTASAQVTTASLCGSVRDGDGRDITGAAVIATHTPSGSKYYGISDKNGLFTITGMRPGGPYSISVSILGFNEFREDGLLLSVGETENVKAVLNEDMQMLEEAVVLAEGSIDYAKTGAVQSFRRHEIDETPSIEHGISDIVKYSPFVNVGSDGSITIAGTNYKYNNFLVDGAGNSDVYGLTSNGFNGGLTDVQPLSLETVEQIQVNVAPFDIRQSGYTGGSINAITKSGTNSWHTNIYGCGDSEWLYGRKYVMEGGRISEPLEPQFHYHAGATVSGPVIKNRLFFFASYERAQHQQKNAYGKASAASSVDAAAADALLVRIKDRAAAQGINYEGEFPADLKEFVKSDKASLKLDWNVNRQHKFSLRWGLVSARELNKTSTASSLVSSDYSYIYNTLTNNVVAELHSSLEHNIHNEFRVSYVDVRDKRNPCGAPFPMIEIANAGGGKVTFGNENSSALNRLDQNQFALTDNICWTLGRHNLVFGTQNEMYHFSNLMIRYPYGTYKFRSPEDFESGVISEYFLGHANVAVTGDPLWAPSFTAAQFGVYAQDKWNVADCFQLTFGLRIDIPVFFNTPECNAEFNAYAASRGWNLRTDNNMKSTPLFSPRLGFRYDFEGEGKYVIRGGAGLFTGRAPFVWFMNKYSDTGIQKTTVSAKNPTGISVIYDPYGQKVNEDIISPDGAQSVTVSENGLKMPQTLKADLAFDIDADFLNISIESVFAKKISDISYRQLAYEQTGASVGSTLGLPWEKRPMYSKTSPDKFHDIYCMSNNPNGYSYSLVTTLQKSFDFGLDLSASYTWSESLSAFESFSTTSESNFCANLTHADPNNPELGYSFFNQPHRVKASVTYHLSYGRDNRWKTTLGLIYSGHSGSAYSLYYYGDLNGDSSSYNDLIFIPTDAQVDAMPFKSSGTFTEDIQKANLKAWLASAPYVKDHRGEYFDRYAANMPFENHFDFHFGQRFSFNSGTLRHSVELTLDIVNVGNLLNPRWGRTYSTLLENTAAFSPITYNSAEKKFQFLRGADYSVFSCNDELSRWHGQIGLKYFF